MTDLEHRARAEGIGIIRAKFLNRWKKQYGWLFPGTNKKRRRLQTEAWQQWIASRNATHN